MLSRWLCLLSVGFLFSFVHAQKRVVIGAASENEKKQATQLLSFSGDPEKLIAQARLLGFEVEKKDDCLYVLPAAESPLNAYSAVGTMFEELGKHPLMHTLPVPSLPLNTRRYLLRWLKNQFDLSSADLVLIESDPKSILLMIGDLNFRAQIQDKTVSFSVPLMNLLVFKWLVDGRVMPEAEPKTPDTAFKPLRLALTASPLNQPQSAPLPEQSVLFSEKLTDEEALESTLAYYEIVNQRFKEGKERFHRLLAAWKKKFVEENPSMFGALNSDTPLPFTHLTPRLQPLVREAILSQNPSLKELSTNEFDEALQSTLISFDKPSSLRFKIALCWPKDAKETPSSNMNAWLLEELLTGK